MTSDDDYLLNEWFGFEPYEWHLDNERKSILAKSLEASLSRLDMTSINLKTAKIVMEELCDWHACNVIDEANRTMGKALAIIKGKLEEINNDGQY